MKLELRATNFYHASILMTPLTLSHCLIYFRSENLFRTMSDLVVSEGYAAAGYEYINVDDCWLEKNRGSRGELVADRKRFPSGMRSLSDYVRKQTRLQSVVD
jgi:hypothetical protein